MKGFARAGLRHPYSVRRGSGKPEGILQYGDYRAKNLGLFCRMGDILQNSAAIFKQGFEVATKELSKYETSSPMVARVL
jgi:hypothetical protein